MKVIAYRQHATGLQLELTWVFAIAAGVVMALALLDYWIWRSWAWLAMLPLLLPLALPSSLVRGRGPTTLTLEEQCLTYEHRYGRRRWRWSDLSAPEMRYRRDPNNRYIVLRLDRPAGWMTRLTLPALRARGTELHVRDIFGTPIDEIATKLNEVRDQALGSVPDRA